MSTSRYPSQFQPGSLIAEITQHFTPEVVRSARSMTGESESSTYGTLQAAAPTVLSGAANMASTSEGANNLAEMIREGGYGGLTENPMSLFRGGSATNYLASAGQRHLGKLFGGNASSVTELVARSGGVSTASASKLMSLIAPLTLGVLGKRISTQGAGSSGLTELLLRQRDEIVGAAPSGLSRILGFGPRVVPSPVQALEHEEVLDSPTHIEHFAEPTSSVEPARLQPTSFSERPAPAVVHPRAGGGGARWLPLLLIILAAIALLSYLRNRPRVPRVTRITSTMSNLARVSLPGGVNLSVPQNSMNYRLAGFLGDNSATDVPRTFIFDHLSFISGSTQLTPDSNKTINDLSQILGAYPSAEVRLTGYTDTTGNVLGNQNLSLDRANAIKTMLVNDGIAANRISTQGFGQNRPGAPNDTEQGGNENRRTELTVTQK
jgi:OmpA-OmpF porin, OOP family